MSKQMTREEAHTLLYNAIKSLWRHDSMHLPDYATDNLTMRTTALSILAPEPRTEPPTVDEVGDEEMCWYWEKTCWYVTVGCDVREGMIGGEYWLPLSALPMPKGTP